MDYMGGAAQVIARAREDFARGDYRWVAQVMNQVVFAGPANAEARALAADALEQMGYQAESATWRNAYLLGAQELRHGIGRAVPVVRPGLMPALSTDVIFDYMAVRLNPSKAADLSWRIAWHFDDTGEDITMTLGNATLTHLPGKARGHVDADVTMKRHALDAVMTGKADISGAIAAGDAVVASTASAVVELFDMFAEFQPAFEIVAPGEAA